MQSMRDLGKKRRIHPKAVMRSKALIANRAVVRLKLFSATDILIEPYWYPEKCPRKLICCRMNARLH
jgi:hypothetical protein